MTETVSHTVDPSIYGRSGDVEKHLDGIKKQYDTDEKRQFYAQVMGDGTSRRSSSARSKLDLAMVLTTYFCLCSVGTSNIVCDQNYLELRLGFSP